MRYSLTVLLDIRSTIIAAPAEKTGNWIDHEQVNEDAVMSTINYMNKQNTSDSHQRCIVRRARRRNDDGQFVMMTDVANLPTISTETAWTTLDELPTRREFQRRRTGRTVIYDKPTGTTTQ